MSILIRQVALAAALLAAGTSCNEPLGPVAVEGSGDRYLFVGNSFTYMGDVPGVVQAMAQARGTDIAVATLAEPDHALQDHWVDRRIQEEIARGDWEMIVLQQGPSAGGIARDSLRIMTRLYAEAAEVVGARVGLFAAWPHTSRRFDASASAESYRLAAGDVGGVLFPVSAAWAEVWGRDPAIELYSDGLHASAAGVYLTGLVIHAVISGESPMGMPATITTRRGARLEVAPAVAATLQAAAAIAVRGG